MNELNYKTVRYPGHHYLMDFLINGLRMGDTLDTQRQLGRIFDRAIPMTLQDVVLVLCAASGWRRGLYTEETNARKIYHQQVGGEHWSAIQLSTAAAACVAIDLHFHQQTRRDAGLRAPGRCARWMSFSLTASAGIIPSTPNIRGR